MKKRKYASGSTLANVGSTALDVFGGLRNAVKTNSDPMDNYMYGNIFGDPTSELLNFITGRQFQDIKNQMTSKIDYNTAPVDNNTAMERLSNTPKYSLSPNQRGFLSHMFKNLVASGQGAANGLSYSGSPWGALVGGIIGGAFNLIDQSYEPFKRKKMENLITSVNSATSGITSDFLSNLGASQVRLYNENSAKLGGPLNTHGGNFQNGVFEVVNGGTHEENPYEGVPMGMDEQGNPNLVEEGEYIWNDYVFSKRMEVPEDMRKKYKLGGKVSYADAVDKVQKESEERPNDPISKRGLDAILTELAMSQEIERQKQQQQEAYEEAENVASMFADGGGLNRKDDYGSKKKPYPSVKKKDFAGGGRSYPIPTKADAVDALRLAGLHHRPDVKAKVYRKYPELKHALGGNLFDEGGPKKKKLNDYFNGQPTLNYDPSLNLNVGISTNSPYNQPVVYYPQTTSVSVPQAGFNNVGTNLNLNDYYKPQPNYGLKISSNKSTNASSVSEKNNTSKSGKNNTSVSGKNSPKKNEHIPFARANMREDYETTLKPPFYVDNSIYSDPLVNEVINNKRSSRINPDDISITPSDNYNIDTGVLDIKRDVKQQSLDNLYTLLNEKLRYAPIAGSLAALLNDLKPIDYSNADRIGNAARRINRFRGYVPLSDYMNYNDVNEQNVLNQLAASQAANTRAINDLSNGNPALRAALMTAATSKYNENRGETASKLRDYNFKNRMAVDQFKSAIAQYNSQMADRAAQMNQNAERTYLTGITQEAAMRNALEAAQSQAVSTDYNSLFDSLGLVGKENATRNMINEMGMPFVYQDENGHTHIVYSGQKKCGGKLFKVKK